MKLTRTNIANRRVHVLLAQDWGMSPGTDFWLQPSSNGWLTAGNAHELADYGWTTTALSFAGPTGADFISAADVGQLDFLDFGAASDLLRSPGIFGDYGHALLAQQFLGYLPTRLVCEFRAGFYANAADEPSTAVGLVEAAGSIITASAADQLAAISTNGTNFELNSGAASDAGAADDGNWHTFKIAVDATNCEWFIDGTSQGTIATEADVFPVHFGCGVVAGGSNKIGLSWVHIWYE